MSLLATAVLHTVAVSAGWLRGLNACTVAQHEWVTPAMVALTVDGTDLHRVLGTAWRPTHPFLAAPPMQPAARRRADISRFPQPPEPAL